MTTGNVALSILSFAATFLVVFVLLDLLFLGLAAKRFYRTQIGPLLVERFRWGPAAAFYAIYALGVVWLCFDDAVFELTMGTFAPRSNVHPRLWINAAVFGFCAYATYNLTNRATLKDWPRTLTFVDMAWGTFATALAAWITAKLWLG